MRLDFNVLWVDDQPDRVKAQIEAIRKQMEAEGFHFNATLCRSVDEVRAVVATDVFTDEIDLILVDWDLGNAVEGQDAIAEIRTTAQYKDVVFYSGLTAPDALRKAAFDRGLEGIYCASRGELIDEVMGVFESLVKKVLDLDHTRGIVMGATSDIDYMVNECLASIHQQLDEPGKAAMFAEALGHMERRIKELTEGVAKLKDAKTIGEFFEAHMVFTANDRLRMLAGALKTDSLKAHKGYRMSVVAYQQKVTPQRNILGHMVPVREGKPKTVIDAEGKPINLDQTRELRRLILRLRSEFRDLMTALQVVP